MSINTTCGIAPIHPEFPHPKPALGNIPACGNYAHQAVKLSSQPFRTLGYIWSRFLAESFL